MKNTIYCKALFHLPENVHYFSGHSLGPITKNAKQQLQQGLHEWENKLVNAWTDAHWMDLPKHCGDKIAPLIGAKTHEVIVCDNTTLNLLKVLLSAVALNNKRKIILTEQGNFPTDNYIAQSVANVQGVTLKALPKKDIIDALNESVAVLMLTHVDYKTAEKWDLAKITKKAHAWGIITVWDLSHSVGMMPIDCSNSAVDFAVGCTYKYLNGGPGAPSFIYVNERHLDLAPDIQGWMGHQQPFAFLENYIPAHGIKRYLSGTPCILSMKALAGALSVYEHLNLQVIEQESQKLTNYLIECCAKHAPSLTLASPRESSVRGNHVAFTHPQADKLACALNANGVVVDYRAPFIRFGISPLYLNHTDLDCAIKILNDLM
ncbi:MAG: kynureninase [Proteobacteria bacterium]|nr:kynureninase [Pseudomonadota bacterium]